MIEPALSPPPVLAGLALVLTGEFAFAGGRDGLARALEHVGARVAAPTGEAPDVIVRGACSARLSALLGPGPAEREVDALAARSRAPVIDEARLVAWLAAQPGPRPASHGTDAPATSPSIELTPRGDSSPAPPPLQPGATERAAPERVGAGRAPGPTFHDEAAPTLAALTAHTEAALRSHAPGARAYLAARIADPRIVDPALRERIARAIERVGGPEALRSLAAALTTLRGRLGVAEAAALGRCLARGDRPHGVRRTPLALEYEPPRERAAAADLLVLAERAGVVEALVDDRGVPVVRVRLLSLPALSSPETAAYQLLRLAGRRRSARLWVGGLALPLALPWPVWLALLSPLTGSVGVAATAGDATPREPTSP